MSENIPARIAELAGIGLFGREIADALGITPQAVKHWVKKLNLSIPDGRKPVKRPLTADLAREYLNYDPETGVFTRRKRTSSATKVGDVVGSMQVSGYLSVSVAGHQVLAHRLAWLYVHGDWPENHIDHINGMRSDNRFANLRDVSNKVNSENKRCAPKSGAGYFGVSFDGRRNAYRSRIMHNGKEIWLGYFDSAEKAHEAYVEAKSKYHEGFVNER